MKVDVSHPEKNVALLRIEVDTERVGRVRDSVYRRLVRRYNIPGFRKGKAPPLILERFIGREAFDREVLDDLLDETYREALDQTGVVPVSRPEVDVGTWERGLALVYEARLTTKPEVTLGQYTGIEIPREEPRVTGEATALEIEMLRQRRAELVDAPEDAPLAPESVAVIDFAGYSGEEPVEGTKAEDYPLEIGSGRFVPGFEEQLVGARVGEQRDVRVTFPDDADRNVSGKEVVFKVTVKGHRRRRLPEADDEFARAVAPLIGVKLEEGQAYGLAELKDELYRRLQAAAENRARSAYEAKVIDQVVSNAGVDIPEVMISNRAAAIREDFEDTLKRRGLALDGYKAASGETDESLDADFRKRAEAEVRCDLVVEAVARKEGISAGEQEVDERIAALARAYGQDPAGFRGTLEANNRVGRIREEIVRGKTIGYLVGAQTPVPVTAAAESPEAAAAGAPVKPKRSRKRPAAAAEAGAAVAAGEAGAGTGDVAATKAEIGANNTSPSDVGIDQNKEEAPPPKRRGAKKGD